LLIHAYFSLHRISLSFLTAGLEGAVFVIVAPAQCKACYRDRSHSRHGHASPISVKHRPRRRSRLMDAVGNNAEHDNGSGEQPHHQSDVLTRVYFM
jgi:hypothetical protein